MDKINGHILPDILQSEKQFVTLHHQLKRSWALLGSNPTRNRLSAHDK